jgi:putative DNA primase/helicase
VALAQIERVDDPTARGKYGFVYKGDLSGLVFLHILHGKRVSASLRRDHVERDGKGRPVAKYLSPPGDSRHAYICPGSDDLLADLNVPAVLVEAQKSVLAVVALSQRAGIPLLPIGTGGCNSASAKRGKKETADGGSQPIKGLLPELDFLKDGRTTFLLFDSNAASNRKVAKARTWLAKELRKQGAVVWIIDLPQLPNVNGPDDFLQLHTDAEFLDLLKAPSPETKPTIVCYAGHLPEVADAAEQVLLNHAEALRVFDRSGQIVRIIKLAELKVGGGLARPAGTVLIESLDKYQVLEIFERLCKFQKATDDGLETADCPTKAAEYYLRRTGRRELPTLIGTIFAPYLRDNGTVVERTGYDPSSGLYLISEETWLPVPDKPTKDDALYSLAVLMNPFQEFAFCSAVDRSILLAAILTGIQRRLLPSAPLFAFSAPKQREGKSMLCSASAVIATGRTAPCQTVSRDDEEFKKVIFSTLLEGHAVICLDNLGRPLKSDALCTVLTEETFSDRILGSSQKFHLPTRTLWLTNGCNLLLKGDLNVRALVCHLDSGTERPEERNFKIPDIVEYLKTHRPELVQAALTILRAHHLHQDETPKITPWGGYDRWSQAIRGPITWLGLADPAGSRKETIATDPEEDAAVLLLHELSDAFPSGEKFFLREVLTKSKEPGSSRLQDAVRGVAERRGQIDHKALGWWFRAWKDRIAEGLCLREFDKSHHAVRWWIEIKTTEAS